MTQQLPLFSTPTLCPSPFQPLPNVKVPAGDRLVVWAPDFLGVYYFLLWVEYEDCHIEDTGEVIESPLYNLHKLIVNRKAGGDLANVWAAVDRLRGMCE